MLNLTPIISPELKKILSEKDKLQGWVDAFGSPLNVIFPMSVVKNLAKFEKTFSSAKVKGEVFYAFKANKSMAILKQLAVSNAGVDVASEKELHCALSAGFTGSRIEATGPKNLSFIRLCILHGVTINVNSLQELKTVVNLKHKLNSPSITNIFLRLKEISLDNLDMVQKDSKFGLSEIEARKALKIIKAHSSLNFYGFSFHLQTISEGERVLAIEKAIMLTLEATNLGLNPHGINIGGGFGLNFLKNNKEWHDYVSALKKSILKPGKQIMSWNNSGLGYWVEGGKLKGSAKFSDFYRPDDQFQELEKILNTKTSSFGNVGQFLQENMLKIYIEPGRSLLDQAGITLARVISVDKSLHGETVVFLDMNRSNMNSVELEFMSDPVVISRGRKSNKSNHGVFLSGNLCLAHDFICRRKVFLNHELKTGDILAFVNTAGYFMDFNESETLQHPIAHKLAVHASKWFLDEKYDPKLF